MTKSRGQGGIKQAGPTPGGSLGLHDGSRVAVVGGGPAGSLFSYFLLNLAKTIDLHLDVDVFEPRSFAHCGPAGCKHCGGIVSETLVQLLATEGILLPTGIVQRGIDSYQLHMDVGDVRILTPLREKRIAAVYRGNGPRQSMPLAIQGFDGFLLDLAQKQGATLQRLLVSQVEVQPDGARIFADGALVGEYDFVAFAAGINSALATTATGAVPVNASPGTMTTFICEFRLGRRIVEEHFGSSMHVFLLDLPCLEFAALIPKGEFVTLCMLGEDVDSNLVETFLDSPEVRDCFPNRVVPPQACHCFPRINVQPHPRPFGDRWVRIGDSGITRLYKDGIGSAYRTAKVAATTAVVHGIAETDFERYYAPVWKRIHTDNTIGHFVFHVSALFQKFRFTRRALLDMTRREQQSDRREKLMSSVLWDVFSGSAPYREVLLRTFRPAFAAGLLRSLVSGNLPRGQVRH